MLSSTSCGLVAVDSRVPSLQLPIELGVRLFAVCVWLRCWPGKSQRMIQRARDGESTHPSPTCLLSSLFSTASFLLVDGTIKHRAVFHIDHSKFCLTDYFDCKWDNAMVDWRCWLSRPDYRTLAGFVLSKRHYYTTALTDTIRAESSLTLSHFHIKKSPLLSSKINNIGV